MGPIPYRGQPADLVTSDPLQESPWAKQGVSVESMQITFVYYGYHIGDLDVCKQQPITAHDLAKPQPCKLIALINV